jgi:hypothetical protein
MGLSSQTKYHSLVKKSLWKNNPCPAGFSKQDVLSNPRKKKVLDLG